MLGVDRKMGRRTAQAGMLALVLLVALFSGRFLLSKTRQRHIAAILNQRTVTLDAQASGSVVGQHRSFVGVPSVEPSAASTD